MWRRAPGGQSEATSAVYTRVTMPRGRPRAMRAPAVSFLSALAVVMGKRITLTKKQIASEAGETLLRLLVEFTADGELSLGEIDRLRSWLKANTAAAESIAAIDWLSGIVEDILVDGRVTQDERVELVLAIERVLPKDERLQAQSRRGKAERVSRDAEPSTRPARSRPERGDWTEDPATERQLDYIRALGGRTRGIGTKGEASDLIDSLLESAASVSNRQMMVLRFWDRVDIASGGRQAVSE